jgi:hypothetical protein
LSLPALLWRIHSNNNNGWISKNIYFDVNESIPTVVENYRIFYHAYVNPDNVYLSLGINGEQLAQWQAPGVWKNPKFPKIKLPFGFYWVLGFWGWVSPT